MTDGTNISQIESSSRGPHATSQEKQERRSERRLEIDNQVKSTKSWLKTLRNKVDKGLITDDQRDEIIARSMVARELFIQIAKDKSSIEPLTRLWSKKEYIDDYSKMVKTGKPFALLVMDLDNFKTINDIQGHQAGDNLLMQTARNLVSSLRQLRPDESKNDKVYRFGGDEFVILLPEVNDEKDLEKVAEKIRCTIGKLPFAVGETRIPITVSIGGAINKKGEKNTFELADNALYAAKDIGKNNAVILTT